MARRRTRTRFSAKRDGVRLDCRSGDAHGIALLASSPARRTRLNRLLPAVSPSLLVLVHPVSYG